MKAILVVAIIATLLIGCGKENEKSPTPSYSCNSIYCSGAFIADSYEAIGEMSSIEDKLHIAIQNKDRNSCIEYCKEFLSVCHNFVNKYGKEFSCTYKFSNETFFMSGISTQCDKLEETINMYQ